MNVKKKVAILGTNGLPARYGGFETLTYYLVEYLAKDFDVTVYCSKTPKKNRIKKYNSAKLKYFPLKANGWQSMIYDFITIFHAFFYSKHLIILGFSGAFAFPFNKIFRRNIVFNIGGIEWQKVRGSKFLARLEIRLKKGMEKLCVINSSTVIIDNASFQSYLEEEYEIKPVLAEYGGDHAIASSITKELLLNYPFLNTDYDLTVSRAQEDMNIHLVIDTYKSLSKRTVVIISNWHISEYGQKLYSENLNKYSNIILLQAIYEPNVLNVIRANCKIYLHTHSLCGTAPSLVEAMSLNLPIVAFDVPANRATSEEKALFFSDVPSLISILQSVEKDDLDINRRNMSEIAAKRYTWSRISDIYRDCINHFNN